jgi:hypothetical protein
VGEPAGVDLRKDCERLVKQWRGRVRVLERIAQVHATHLLRPDRERAALKASVFRQAADELERLMARPARGRAKS